MSDDTLLRDIGASTRLRNCVVNGLDDTGFGHGVSRLGEPTVGQLRQFIERGFPNPHRACGSVTRKEGVRIMQEMTPTATEEQDHIWINTENGAVNLTAEVALAFYKALNEDNPDSVVGPIGGRNTLVDGHFDLHKVTAAVLAHPIIAAALAQYERLSVPSGDIEADGVKVRR